MTLISKVILMTTIAGNIMCPVHHRMHRRHHIVTTPVTQRYQQQDWLTNSNTIMLDVARRHMTTTQILQFIANINTHDFKAIELHLNDNSNYAIASPLLQQPAGNGELSLHDLQLIVRFANWRGLTVIPDIDVPSHCQALISGLKAGNNQFHNSNLFMDSQTLDYTNPQVTKLITTLYSEVLPAFATQQHCYWMVGCDEVPGNISCANQLATMLNQLDKLLNQHGFTMLVWNDSINQSVLSQLQRNIEIADWTTNDDNHLTTRQYQQAGHKVIDANSNDCYMNICDLRNSLEVQHQITRFVAQPTGKMLCLWGSNPTDAQITNQMIVNYLRQVQSNM